MVDRMAGAGRWEIISLTTKKTKRGRKTVKAAEESGVNWTWNEALNSQRPPQWCKWWTYPIGTAPVHNLPKQFRQLGTKCLMSEPVGDIFFFSNRHTLPVYSTQSWDTEQMGSHSSHKAPEQGSRYPDTANRDCDALPLRERWKVLS